MLNNIQYIVVLIDRSGSMAGKESDTIGGINYMLDELKNDKKENEEIFVTIKLFDHEILTLFENKEIDDIFLLKEKDFIPRGQTAIVDSLGITLEEIIRKKKENIIFYNSCLVYVTTDGLENCSHIYTKNHVKNLIKEAKVENIDVLYLGANQDSFLEAETMGFNLNSVMNYSECPQTIRSAYSSIAQVASRTRSLGGEASFTEVERQLSQNNKEEIKEPKYPAPPILTRQTNLELLKNPLPITRNKSRIN